MVTKLKRFRVPVKRKMGKQRLCARCACSFDSWRHGYSSETVLTEDVRVVLPLLINESYYTSLNTAKSAKQTTRRKHTDVLLAFAEALPMLLLPAKDLATTIPSEYRNVAYCC